jgi:hypothetical protein
VSDRGVNGDGRIAIDEFAAIFEFIGGPARQVGEPMHVRYICHCNVWRFQWTDTVISGLTHAYPVIPCTVCKIQWTDTVISARGFQLEMHQGEAAASRIQAR